MNTTISIKKTTRTILQEIGKKSESYDDIILNMYNTIKLMELVNNFVNEEEFSSLDDAKEWTKLQIKAMKK